MHAQTVLVLLGLVAAASCQLLAHVAMPLAHIPITRTDYSSMVNHIVPIPAPIIKGVPQPYAVPVPQPFAVPRAVMTPVPRPIAVEVPRAVPVPMIAKAPTMFTMSLIDAGTKVIDARPVAHMMNAWGPKMWW